ncbi:MAG: hypothetical protein JXQ65_13755 [Candidatus Marinimicrobia bacterium]|nr:hypothetical protein [Candidatus Neomarinimicrobiota bacterium]
MSVIHQLSSVLGKSGNEGEIALANQIVMTENHHDVAELVQNLANKNKGVRSDCIKTLYEIGYRAPELIAEYHENFLQLLMDKNNRMIWGAMVALAIIAELKSAELFGSLDLILNTMAQGSVITLDGGMEILAKLNKFEAFTATINPILLKKLRQCPIKQLPQYLEKSLVSVNPGNREAFLALIDTRLNECERESQRKRLKKIIRAMNEK